jgi:hypothetical protein
VQDRQKDLDGAQILSIGVLHRKLQVIHPGRARIEENTKYLERSASKHPKRIKIFFTRSSKNF